MNTTFKMMALACAMPLVLTACGKHGAATLGEDAKAIKADSRLQNHRFVGECSLKVMGSIVSGIATGFQTSVKSAREEYRFVGANSVHTTSLFTSSDCSGDATIQFRQTGVITIRDNEKQNDITPIDMNVRKLYITVNDDNGVKIAHDMSMCGTADWSKTTEKDVTAQAADLNCSGQSLPVTVLQIYKINNDNLYFGAPALLGKAGIRPPVVDEGTPFHRN